MARCTTVPDKGLCLGRGIALQLRYQEVAAPFAVGKQQLDNRLLSLKCVDVMRKDLGLRIALAWQHRVVSQLCGMHAATPSLSLEDWILETSDDDVICLTRVGI